MRICRTQRSDHFMDRGSYLFAVRKGLCALVRCAVLCPAPANVRKTKNSQIGHPEDNVKSNNHYSDTDAATTMTTISSGNSDISQNWRWQQQASNIKTTKQDAFGKNCHHQ